MPPIGDLIAWFWVVAIAFLAFVAVMTPRGWVRVLLVLMSWAALWWREFGARAIVRGRVSERHHAGLNVEDFREGADVIVDWLDRTGPQVLFPALALGIVAIWGGRRDGGSGRSRSSDRVLGVLVGGLCLAWFVVAAVTKSLGEWAWTLVIWGLFLVAIVVADARSDAGRVEDETGKGSRP